MIFPNIRDDVAAIALGETFVKTKQGVARFMTK